MDQDEIRNRAKDILMGVSDDSQYWVMEKVILAQKVGCSSDELASALRTCLNFDLQGIQNFENLAYAYYSDSDLKDGFYGF